MLISPLFMFYGRNLSNFSLVFWSKRWQQKDILKLTDLYAWWYLSLVIKGITRYEKGLQRLAYYCANRLKAFVLSFWIRNEFVLFMHLSIYLVVMGPSRAGSSQSSSWRIFSLARLDSWPFPLQLEIENRAKTSQNFYF